MWLGLIFASFGLSRFIITPMIGRLTDVRGRKTILLIGLAAYSVMSYAYLLAHNPLELTIYRGLHGAASAMVLPIALAYAGEMAPAGREGRHLGIFNLSFFLGFGGGPLIGGFLADNYGLSSAFYAMTALSASALALSLLFLPESQQRMQRNAIRFRLFYGSSRVVAVLSLFNLLTFLGRMSLFAFLAIYAVSIHLTLAQIGLLLTMGAMIMTALQVPFGRLADRYNKMTLMIVGTIISAVGLVFIPWGKDFFSLLMLNALVGLGGAIGFPSSMALATQVGREEGMGTVMGDLDSARSLGVVVGPLMSGVLVDWVGLEPMFIIIGLVSVAGAGVLMAMARGLTVAQRPATSRVP